MGLKINRANWKKVKLGDVAFEYSKRINNPSESEFDRFVGSSNIDQWDFRVRNWEPTYSVTSTMKLFEPNDYLLVRRSLYASDFRERAPRAHFHGVCSGDILTIKENSEKVVDGFLIGVFNSPALWKYVVANASGSITRRIKWKDLSNYEFLLPPKDQQAQLAELLWAMDEVIEREKELLEMLEAAYSTMVDSLFSHKNQDFVYVTLNEIAEVNKMALKNSHDPNYKFKYLDIASIVEPKSIGELKWIEFKDAPSRARRIVSDSSIVLSLVRPYFKAFVFIYNSKDVIASTGTGVIDVKPGHIPKFVFHQFFSKRFMKFCEDRMTGTNYPAITPSDLDEFQLAFPSNIETEKLIVDKLDGIDSTIILTKDKIYSSSTLQKSIINQIF